MQAGRQIMRLTVTSLRVSTTGFGPEHLRPTVSLTHLSLVKVDVTARFKSGTSEVFPLIKSLRAFVYA